MTKVKFYDCGCGNMKFEGKTDMPEETKATFDSLARNGTFCPGIDEVTINKPKNGSKKGTIHVKFKDGSKVTVRNTDNDAFVPETGLVYAIVKRMFGLVKDNGDVSAGSYMSKMAKILSKARDPEKEETARKAKEAAEAKAKEDAENAEVDKMVDIVRRALAKIKAEESEGVVTKVIKSIKKSQSKSKAKK